MDQLFLEKVVKAAGIETRYWCIDPKYFSRESGLLLGGRKDIFVGHTERQKRWRKEATNACVYISRELLKKCKIPPKKVGYISFNSTTGYANVNIATRVAARIGAPHSVRCTQILGQGCSASIPNLVRCAEGLESGNSFSYGLALSAEFCSLTFQPHTHGDRGYQVCVIIFGDGAGGVLLKRTSGESKNPVIIDYESYWQFKTFKEMSFELESEGFRFILSRRVPKLIGRTISEPVNRLLKRNGLEKEDIQHWVFHQGGLAILKEAYGALGLNLQKHGAISLEMNKRYGNQSSASIIFDLKRLIDIGEWRKGERAVLASFGPGLNIELILLQKGI